MRPFDLVCHRLAEVVQQRGALGHLHARADLRRHDAREMHDLERVLEDVLAVARAIAQAPEDLHELLVELPAVRLEDPLLPGLHDRVLDLRLRGVIGVFDASRVNPAVLDQLREREPCDLAPDAVERGQHDRLRRVVDDEVDAGEMLERADVAPLPADDPTLHVVGGELDDGHGRLGGVARRDALQGVGDEIARPPLRLRARLLLELPDPPCELVPDEILRAFQEVELRLVDGHARDPLELGELLLARILVLLLELPQVRLTIGEPLLAARHLGQLPVDLLFLREHSLLDLDDPAAVLCDFLVDLRTQLDRLLASGDLRLPPKRFRFALGVVDQLLPLLLGCAEARLAERADCDCTSQSPGDEADQNPDGDLHWLSSWVGCPRPLPRRPTRQSGRHGRSRIGETSRHRGSESGWLDRRCQEPFGVGLVGG